MIANPRALMGGKPVLWIPGKSTINMDSGFKHKLLCDGPTFSTGVGCQYSCSFCYVPSVYKKLLHDKLGGFKHEDVVIRRENAIAVMKSQLTDRKGNPRFADPDDRRVIYSSPAVDVASNMELVAETVEACKLILKLTNWHIRLLSKSNLLPKIAIALQREADGYTGEDMIKRMIFGVSTGTLDNKLAAAFEAGTAKVSKRIESLHWLQDNGFRTFGMICPSLPQADYRLFADTMHEALRADKLEHVWAEPLNARGESMERTCKALTDGGYADEAKRLAQVHTSADAWEEYAQETFLAHAPLYEKGQLRFLQYVDKRNADWWKPQVENGAVLLGKFALPTS